MLDRFKKIISSTNDESNYKKEMNKDFNDYFESNSYQYLVKNELIKEEYIHLFKIPSNVLNNIKDSINQESNDFWKDIINHKNRKSKTVTSNIPLKVYWVTFDKMNLAQKEFYYYFREQVLQGNFIKADLSYVFLFIYEGLYYQWSNYPGFVISLIEAVYRHYRQEPSYTNSLDKNVPQWINGLLLENNEPKLAAKFMFSIEYRKIINNHPLLLAFAEGKRNFSMKKIIPLIRNYNEDIYKRHQRKINDIFTETLFMYCDIYEKTLFQIFVKQSAREETFSKNPFNNANCYRKVDNNKGYVLFYEFRKEDIYNLFSDIYKLSYNILSDESVSLDYLSLKEIRTIKENYNQLLEIKEKEKVDKIIEKTFGKTDIHEYVQKELLNNKKIEKGYKEINKELNELLEKNLNENSFLELFNEKYYDKKLSNIFLNEKIILNRIPNNVFRNYYESVEVLPKNSFFHQIMKYRTKELNKKDDISIEEYKKILKEGVIYYHLLKPKQILAYLYFRENIIKGNFLENIHFSFIQLFLSEVFHFNITTNPKEIVGLIEFIIIKYNNVRGFNSLKVKLLLQAFLKECNLNHEASIVSIYLTTDELNKMKINEFNKLDFSEVKSINTYKKYIKNYAMFKEKQTKINNIFKELLPFYNKYTNELKSLFVHNVTTEYKVDNIYKEILIQRKSPIVTYNETMYKFDEDYFIEFISEFYLFVSDYVNEKYEEEYTYLENINQLKEFLDSKYKKVKKKTKAEIKKEEEMKEIEEFKKNLFDFDEKEIESLKELHAIKEEVVEKDITKNKQKEIELSILSDFLKLFNEDELELNIAEQYAKKNKLSLNKLILETNKKLNVNISIEDNMLYND